MQALKGDIERSSLAFRLLVEPELRKPEVDLDGRQYLHWPTILHAWRKLPRLDCGLRSLVQAETQRTYHCDVGCTALLIDYELENHRSLHMVGTRNGRVLRFNFVQ